MRSKGAVPPAATLTIALVIGCQPGSGSPVPVPASDSTLPVVSRLGTVDRAGEQLVVTPASGPVAGGWAQRPSLVISAHVDDPEGVQEVAIWGTTETTCVAPDGLASKEGPGLAGAPLVASTDTTPPGGSGWSGRDVTYTINSSDFRCSPGTVQLYAKQVFWATGRNFGKGEAKSATLTLTYSDPSAVASSPQAKPQRISGDPYQGDGALHATVVEPDSYSHGSTVVAVFQVGRFAKGGGASAIGFATSTDAGQTWKSGYLPGVTTATASGPTDPSEFTRATDPSVTYDDRHKVWLASSLQARGPFNEVTSYPEGKTNYVVSRSLDDGLTWSDPIVSAPPLSTPTGYQRTYFAHDQGWISCDNWAQSRYYGRCYLNYVDVANARHALISSNDGGMSWSAPVPLAASAGARPVVRPNGELIVISHFEATPSDFIGAVRSSDGGATFSTPTQVAPHTGALGGAMWTVPGAMADVASADGKVFVAFEDCSFRTSCTASDIVVASTDDGVNWTVVAGPVPLGSDHYMFPALAVDSASAGANTKLALTYYSMLPSCAGTSTSSTCELHVNFVSSVDAGRMWSAPRVIDDQASQVGWQAYRLRPDRKYFVGDYVGSTSFAGPNVVAAFPLADQAPNGDRLSQPIWSVTIPVP